MPRRVRVKPAVLKVLRLDPTAREDTNRLVWGVCREMGHDILPEHVEMLSQLPNFSSIIRARAKIQEMGRFRPEPSVWRSRRRNRKRNSF